MSERNGDLPTLPAHWEWVELADVAGDDGIFTDGDWILSVDLQSGDDVRLLQLSDIGVGRFLDKSSKYISERRFEEIGCTEVQPGDLLISRMAEPIGRACLVPVLDHRLITAVDVTICRVSNAEFDPGFVMHALNSSTLTLQAERASSGTTRKRVSRKNLAKLKLPKPPLAEQQDLVAALEAVESAILEPRAALRDAALDVRRFVIASQRDLFANWSTEKLGSLAEIRSGLAKGRKTKGDVQPRPYLRAGNLGNGELLLDEIKEIEATDAEAERFRLENGDVLLVEGSGSPSRLGQGWIWENQIPGCLHQNHVFAARPDQTKVVPRFLAWALQGPDARAQLLAMAKTTSGLATLNKKQASSLDIPVPPLDDQDAIVERLEAVQRSADALMTALLDGQAKADALMRSARHELVIGRRALTA